MQMRRVTRRHRNPVGADRMDKEDGKHGMRVGVASIEDASSLVGK
jgi:hypothetical protein